MTTAPCVVFCTEDDLLEKKTAFGSVRLWKITHREQFERAVQALADAGGHVKTAIVSVLLDCDAEQAVVALERARGHVRAAVSGHEKSNADAQ